MATTLPRIQAYVSEELHEKFASWRRKRGFEGDSKGLNQLLTEFFSRSETPNIVSSEHSARIESPGLEAKITEIVEDQLSDLQWLIDSTVDCKLREVAGKLPSVDQVHARIDEVVEQRLAEQGRTWIDPLEERLCHRIYLLEQKQAEILRKREEPAGDLEALVSSKIDSEIKSLKTELEARFPSVVAQIEEKVDVLTDQVSGLETQLKGEKSLTSSLTIKVMSLQTKVQGLKLSLPSNELPDELPGELSRDEDLDFKESDNKMPDNLPSEFSETYLSLTGAQLAKRLDVNRSTLPRKRDKPDFGNWSQARDPEAIAWEYDAEEKIYRSKVKDQRTGTSKLKSLAILHKGGG